MAKILIVDDRITNRELLLTLLSYAGHQLLEATDGEEGLAITRAEHPDLIITDIMMPKMDGYEFAHQVRADSSIKNTQIIFYTSSYIVAETLRLASACGVSTVIGKPIDPENFLKKVDEALKTKKVPTVIPTSEEFHREHMRVLTDTLVNKVEQLEEEILERKQMQSIIEASELRFRSLIEHGLDNISLLKEDGTLIWESPAAVHILGYDFNEYLGRNLFDLIYPDDLDKVMQEFQELIKEPNAISHQSFRVRHAKGNWIWVEGISTNLLSEPSIGAIVINYRDVTERKQAQEALRQSEERFSKAFYQSPIGISLTDLTDNTIREVNSELLKMIGLPREQIIGFSASQLNIHFDEKLRSEAMLELKEHGVFLNKEVRIGLPDGSFRDALFSGALIQIDGKPHNLNFMADITDRKRAEESVRYQANLLQNVSDGIISTNMQSIITSWNPAAKKIYGWDETEAVGTSITNLLQTEYEGITQDNIRKDFMEKGSWQGEVSQKRKDGSRITVLASVSLVRDLDGKPATMVAINRDITEQKRAEQKLRQSDEQYRSLFDNSPISFWLEDFSEVKKRLDALQESGVNDVPAYLRNNPEFLRECANLIKVLDVNTAAINLYHASNKSDLLGNLSETVVPMVLSQIEYELIQLSKGELNFEREGVDQTLTGQKVYVNIHWSVVPGYEHNLSRVIVSAIDVTEKKRAEQKIHHQLQRLNALRSIDLAISNTFDMKLSLRVLLNGTILQLGVDAASILLFNRSMNRLEYSAGEGFDTSIIQTTNLRIGEGYAGRVALERKNFYVKNVAGIEGGVILNKLFEGEKFVSYYAVPLIAKGELKGVLEIFNRSELVPIQEWVDFLEILAGQAAIAIDNAQLFEGMQRSNLELSLAYDATIEGWSTALDLRDKETEGHSQRVTDMTVALARRMGISESDLIQIRRGSLLHDIGKLGVPDHILLKPDKLNDEEWEVMKKHPIYAHNMLSSIAYLKYALDIPLCHHEKWDGSGYPRGLKNQEIPLAARIFAIVDVWDALTSNRPYRPAWTRERAIEFIKEQSNTHFDPQVVQAFFNMMDNK